MFCSLISGLKLERWPLDTEALKFQVLLYIYLPLSLTQKLGGESDSEEAFGRQRTFADLMSRKNCLKFFINP